MHTIFSERVIVHKRGPEARTIVVQGPRQLVINVSDTLSCRRVLDLLGVKREVKSK